MEIIDNQAVTNRQKENIPMYTITDKLFKIGDYRYYSPTYVETGACGGESIKRAQDGGFPLIKSVELHEPYFQTCVQRFKGQNVELFLGKSTDNLHKMLADVYIPAVIFLDAHPAGEGTESHEEYLKGNVEYFQHTILSTELDIILDHRKDHLICIDDQILGPEADSYMAKLVAANPKYTFFYYNEQLAPHDPVAKNKVLVCIP